MANNFADIVDNIRSTLKATDPTLDTSTGTTTRKIIDAVAEVVSEAYIDQHLLSYTYDIDSKSGTDLDSFCQVFGVQRLPAKRSSGNLTFTLPTAATDTVIIPTGTQVASNTIPVLTVATLSVATIPPGETTATVPAQTVAAGVSGNVAPGTLVTVAVPINQVISVTNISAFTGGSTAETDDELAERFKRTVLRSLAGTTQMYLGIAGNNPDCASANLVPAVTHRVEQIQISGTTGQSTVNDAKSIYTSGYSVSYNGLPLAPTLDYTFDGTTTGTNGPAPTITMSTSNLPIPDDFGNNSDTCDTGSTTTNIITTNNAFVSTGSQITFTGNITTALAGVSKTISVVTDSKHATVSSALTNAPVAGDTFTFTKPVSGIILDVEFDYADIYSRNLPTSGITNRVDLYVAGATPTDAAQSLIFSNSTTFNNTSTSPYYATNWVRTDGTHPTVGNIFLPLAFGPILSLPSTLTAVGGLTYTQNADFWIVHDNTAFGWGPKSNFGIEWRASGSAPVAPVNGAVVAIGTGYTYNALIGNLQADVNAWRLGGVDAMVHQAHAVSLRVNVVIDYATGASQTATNNAMTSAVSTLFQQVGFNGVVQVSDVLAALHSADGVDNVRLATSTDNGTSYAIQKIVSGSIASTYATGGRAIDIIFDDASFPVLESVKVVSIRAQNTFMTGA